MYVYNIGIIYTFPTEGEPKTTILLTLSCPDIFNIYNNYILFICV